jgi:hypothetical protein
MIQQECRLCFQFGSRSALERFVVEVADAGIAPTAYCRSMNVNDVNKAGGVTLANTYLFVPVEGDDDDD